MAERSKRSKMGGGGAEGGRGWEIVIIAVFHSLTAFLSLVINENHNKNIKVQLFGFTLVYNFLTYAYF